MIFHIARKEFLCNLHSARFVIGFLLCLVLVVSQTSGMIAETFYPIKSRRILNTEKDIQKKTDFYDSATAISNQA
jgi:hypothetical protein